VLQEEKESK
jgi:hypothetical protein